MPIDKKAAAEIGSLIVNRSTALAIIDANRALTKEAAQRHSAGVLSGEYSAAIFLDELEKIAAAEEAGVSFDEFKARNPLSLDDIVRS